MQIKEITANNIIEKIQEQVKGYPQEPMYLLRINQEYCTYEVLVNDFPVYENYDLGVSATGTKINRAILKSGEQTVTLRMYPIGNLEQEAYGDEMPYYKTLKGGSSMRIEVIKVPDWKNYDIAAEEIIKVVTTEGFDTNKFPGAGLPYYEFTFPFIAEVPYENEGWSNGVDLRKVDTTILRKKIWSYFKSEQKILENKDVDSDAKAYFNLFAREAKSEYWDKEKTERVCNERLDITKIKDKEFQPFKNYELVFYGEGKIATFKHSSGLDIDSRLRGTSALYFLYDDQSMAYFPGLYLYMDKDKYNDKEEELQLEMIK
ncbi:hypothetical protein [Tenacibaculum sp. Bg11-29]|uniref:hypothetical protein n=1 Tax=Tenacibaculum sp. Bg11-29 TaxID=2058306 RepID=UPI0018E3E93A|nr:hypothetical protein [Tenacibaculum sp. Bg11-29]